jgi:predicted nucleic acid-binding protein
MTCFRPRVVRALLDVNVLIALPDSDHTSRGVAMNWLVQLAREGWVSCPITQNGCIRIMSSLSYLNALPVQAVMKRLADACEEDVHEFRSDEISLLNPAVVYSTRPKLVCQLRG